MQLYPFIDIHNHNVESRSNNDVILNNNIVSICSFFVQAPQLSLNQYSGYFTLGLHPWHVDAINLDDALLKMEQVACLPTCIGIGEIGLDKTSNTSYNKQLIAFEQQVILAKKMELPIIIHNVKSLSEILQVIKKIKFNQPVIFHGFTGKIETAQQILNAGAYLSFGKSLNHVHTSKVLDLTPVNSIFFETDESEYSIEEIYGMAAVLLHTSVDACKQIVYNNFIKIFTKYNAELA